MSRVIELLAGLLGCVLGLCGVTYEVQELQSPLYNVKLNGLLGSGGLRTSDLAAAHRLLLVLAMLLVVVALGAYLHAVYHAVVGLALLWISTLFLLSAFAASLVLPNWPATGPWQLNVIPVWVTVLTVALTVVSGVAAVSPPGPELLSRMMGPISKAGSRRSETGGATTR